MKLLIIRFSSIGDIVLTTPVVRTLKTTYPDAEIHYLTKPQYAPLLRHNPYLSQIHLLDQSLNQTVSHLKKEHFDYVIDLHKSLRSRIVRLRLGVKSYSFPKLNWQKWLYVNFKINRMPNVHLVDRYMEAVEPLDVKMDNLGLDMFLDESDEFDRKWLPEAFRQEFVVYAIGGQHNTKKLPYLRMVELCDRIGKPTILIGGKEDAEMGQRIEDFFSHEADAEYAEGLRQLGKDAQILNLCGKLTLTQSASLIRQARVIFTHDTGMMHIAAAFRKQIYSIWGNTTPHFGMYPYRTKFTVFENNKLGCRPCSKIGHAQCPKGHFKCMNEVVFDFWIP